MLTPDQEKLKEAALAATPGPWTYFPKPKYNEHHVSVPIENSGMRLALFDDGCQSNRPEQDAKFIAAANPAAILAILAQLEQVQGDAARYNLLFNIDNFCQDELWTVVDWMRGGPDDPTKADVDAALDEYAAKQAAAVQPLPPPPEAA